MMKARAVHPKGMAYIGSIMEAGVTRPRIGIQGFWLHNFGFRPGMSAVVEFTPGQVVVTAYGKGIKPKWFGKVPYVSVESKELAYAGFIPGELVSVSGQPGCITIQRFERK